MAPIKQSMTLINNFTHT